MFDLFFDVLLLVRELLNPKTITISITIDDGMKKKYYKGGGGFSSYFDKTG